MRGRRQPKFLHERGPRCSFCGRRKEQARKLIAGPGVCICDECINLCNEIMAEQFAWPWRKG